MMRLDKMLAHSGYGTRKEVKELIRKGYVLVNGEVIINDDYKVDEDNDEIIIADEVVDYEKQIYLMLNKPDGYVSATFDHNDPTVLDLIYGYENRNLFPVGRLDKDTHALQPPAPYLKCLFLFTPKALLSPPFGGVGRGFFALLFHPSGGLRGASFCVFQHIL